LIISKLFKKLVTKGGIEVSCRSSDFQNSEIKLFTSSWLSQLISLSLSCRIENETLKMSCQEVIHKY
jgi:hypothetical protein